MTTPEGRKGVEASARHPRGRLRLALYICGGLIALIGVGYVLHRLGGGDGFSLVSSGVGDWAYLAVFAFVFGDAVFPLLPGETALNAASTLAAAGSLDLTLVILAGTLGAIAGDSALYWIARLSGERLATQVAKAKSNEKVAVALSHMGSNAPLLIVAGRYVPGLRFVVNATMGVSRYPYRRFLLWSALGGALWAAYTCGLAYLVGTALADFPLASVIVSLTITTVAVAVIFLVIRRRRKTSSGEATGQVSSPPAVTE